MEKPQKTSIRTQKYIFVGLILTGFNFLVYALFANVIIKNNDLLWLASAISYTLTTFLAYFLHSKITWKERHPDKTGIVKFFLWNFITALIISPAFTWLFTLLSPLYSLLFNFSSFLSLPFSYEFIESTSVFVLTTLITMILNYIFYDKLVFQQNEPKDC